MKKEKMRGEEGEYILYRHEAEAGIPSHWVLRPTGGIKKRKGWIEYLRFSEKPVITTTNDGDDGTASYYPGNKGEEEKKAKKKLLLQARPMGKREIIGDLLLDPSHMKWMDECCATSNYQALEGGTFFLESSEQEGKKVLLYFEGIKLAGRYQLTISNAELNLWQFMALPP